MKLNSFDKVKQLTEEMVAIPSINKEPGGESAVARYIQDFYMSLPYFQAHPEQVKCFQTKNDFVVRPEAQRQIKTRMFYPYISDSSFMAVCDDTLAIQALETNMPQYGVKYTHPVDKIRQIDVPVVNIGTFGRDGHMLTERVDMRQTFQNVPNITYEAVKRLLS